MSKYIIGRECHIKNWRFNSIFFKIVQFYTIYTSRQRGSLKLFDSIASAEVEKQIVHNVLSTIKANQEDIEYEIGIKTSLDEKDVFNYVQQVIKETRTK